MDERKEPLASPRIFLNTRQLQVLHHIALRGDVPSGTLQKEFNLTSVHDNYLMEELIQAKLLVKTDKKGECCYSVNAAEFLSQLNQMTHRVKTMISECDSLLGNTAQ